jgi:phenylacetic acid degradation operon negative regulatory protein
MSFDAPVSNYVYSSFSYFGSARGGELPGRWFVAALAEVGCDEAAVRQTLYRMERSGELLTRREGREKLYRPTGYAQGEITAGTGKIFDPPAPWDGRWTLLHARFEKEERIHRERLQVLLQVEGFASAAPGLYIHPRPRGERVLAAVDPTVRDRVLVVRGDRIGPESDERFVARHWDVPALAQRYRETLHALGTIEGETASGCTDVEAFRRRFEIVLRFLRVAWDDPDLPTNLLPPDWPGNEARERAEALYRRFRPGALRFGDRVLSDIGRASMAGQRR